ncbi:MAG: hypothetical protein KIS66_15775 [Fimbriimonadaceae bacterium]|nr:hypothetical protein [Fimbriimonadaceae bacterium]
MVELPEASCVAAQLRSVSLGHEIRDVVAGHTPHRWAWFSGDPGDYPQRLVGRSVQEVVGWGGFVVVLLSGGTRLLFGEGTRLRWLPPGRPAPDKHQLWARLGDGSQLVASIQMYGFLQVEDQGEVSSAYALAARDKPSPLTGAFDPGYFASLFPGPGGPELSVKALLATEQRIPGFGNGVLQDVLFEARLHPRRLASSLSEDERGRLYRSVRTTLAEMAAAGGRHTEIDLFGQRGGYPTRASARTVGTPCPRCGQPIVKEAYLGGSVYTCPVCQPRS